MNSTDEKLNSLWKEYQGRVDILLFHDIGTMSDCRFIKAFCGFILDRVEYQEKILKFVEGVEHE